MVTLYNLDNSMLLLFDMSILYLLLNVKPYEDTFNNTMHNKINLNASYEKKNTHHHYLQLQHCLSVSGLLVFLVFVF